MKLRILEVALAVAAAVSGSAQDLEIANYDIEVGLDPGSHRLAGSESIRWRNTTPVATSEVWLHLYLNAFAGSETTFMREIARDPSGAWGVEGDGWGWIRVTRLSLPDGTDLMSAMTFERPDDGNPGDFTVARVALPGEVFPGETVELEIDFEAQLPEVVARTGYAGDFHMVAQWFPKLGVFEGESGWNCHQFHAASEFYADFGTYRVTMTIPRGWVVGATGEQISREPVATADVVEFVARAVHDFAWATAPPDLMSVVETDFEPGRHVPQVWLERAAERLGVGAAELELPPMIIRLLVPRSQEVLAPRMIRAVRLAAAWFGLHLGPYPYPQLTVVSPPPEAKAAGGMEYPTLFTTGASRLDAYPPWSWRNDLESVTAHELGHQYFQGMLASNEFEQAWLDEGLTTWAHLRCLDDITDDGLVPQIRLPGLSWELGRVWLSRVELPVAIDRPVWKQRRLSDTFFVSYAKTALAMRTLGGLLGEDRLLRAVRAYVDEYRFRHPTGDDLRRILERETGDELGWFEGVFRDGHTPDWTVLGVRHTWIGQPEGLVLQDGEWRTAGGDDGADTGNDTGNWLVDIDLGRRSELVGPVEVELTWETGRVERRVWDGKDRWIRWSEASPEVVIQVIVDPDGDWVLETARSDNYWRDEHWPREQAAAGPLWWLDGALRLIGLATVPGS